MDRHSTGLEGKTELYIKRAGRNLLEDAGFDTLEFIQELYSRGQTIWLTQLYPEHRILGDLVNLRWWRRPRWTTCDQLPVPPAMRTCGLMHASGLHHICSLPASMCGALGKIHPAPN